VEFKTGLPRERVAFALELALEQAVCEFFKIPECHVDMEDKNVTLFFLNSLPMSPDKTDKTLSSGNSGWEKQPEISLERLHKAVVKKCRRLFLRNLSLMESAQLHEKWKRRVHQAVEGVIDQMGLDRVEIHLGDNVRGVMLKPEWVPREISLYRPGAVFWFYLTKVTEEKDGVTVHLSRGSKNLPAALIRGKLPWAKVQVVRRIRGNKTWLKAGVPVDPEILAEVRRELNGEVIEVVG
jgi:hypothetical protein